MSLIEQFITPAITGTRAPAVCNKESLCFWPQFNQLVSYPVILGGHFAYIAIVFALRAYMRTREKPFNPKFLMLMYNITQVVLSLAMTVGLAPYLVNNMYNLGGSFTADIEFWILVHYAAKFFDMMDTVFMVLRKSDKQLSFLHLYHHLTIGMIWGMLLHWGVGNGTAFFGAWINSLVHALMYTHYLLASFGVHNPFKKYLTQFQMLQFGLCILHAVLVLTVDPTFPRFWAMLQASYHPTLLVLFADYYTREIKAKKAAAKVEAKKAE